MYDSLSVVQSQEIAFVENLISMIFFYGISPPVLAKFLIESKTWFLEYLTFLQLQLFHGDRQEQEDIFFVALKETPTFWLRVGLILTEILRSDYTKFYEPKAVQSSILGITNPKKIFREDNHFLVFLPIFKKQEFLIKQGVSFSREYRTNLRKLSALSFNYTKFVYPEPKNNFGSEIGREKWGEARSLAYF